jgi:predicted ATP-dependent serine protease
MAKAAPRYVCQNCGASARKWMGRCESCGAWNTVVEEAPAEAAPKGLGAGPGRKLNLVGLKGAPLDAQRLATGIAEFDRVTGGGLVPGSAVLIGGDPGIGKSTLLLQVVAALSRQTGCLFVSGEESVDQVRMRAARLGLAEAPATLAAATSVRDIVTSLDAADAPRVAVIDSIQTMYVDTLDSTPGTVAQVRASAQELIRLAKRRGAVVLLVGHVTKEGMIAGPRVLEHMVDTVLYFEGERGHQFRILRAVKNPRRAVVGWDTGRLAMVLAVLEARCGLAFAGRDVYLNVAGGLRVAEPAADLAVAAALVSSLQDRPVPPGMVVFGEIGLSGEVRPVSQTDSRLKEAEKLGFTRALMPPLRPAGARGGGAAMEFWEIRHLSELMPLFDGGVGQAPRSRTARGGGPDG